ncbi:MAG: 4-hydroxy-tetrahydrodipicolinate reductase [Thermomicrobiales bacterium]
MTVRIGIAGLPGRMGREVSALALRDSGVTLAGGWSRGPQTEILGVPVTGDLDDLLTRCDVLIDFTKAEATPEIAAACAASATPLVTGVTGLDEAQAAALRNAATHTAVFQAANMSPGVNAMLAVLPALVRALQGYDLELVEAHHRYKADAPSGTAIALARVMASASGAPLAERAVYGREGASLRQPPEIGIHAVRAGGNPGEHSIILASDGEEIRLSHRAFNRSAYAEGALKAARLIIGQPAGWYEPATLPGFL